MASSQLVAGKYKISKKIDVGSISEIYLGRSVDSGEEVAIKLEPTAVKFSQLVYESKAFLHLQGGEGIPRFFWSGVKGSYHVLVMELLGPNLEELFKHCSRRLSLKTVLMLALQMIERVEYVHTMNFVHRDIKPRNFLIGRGKCSKTVFIIDYGLSRMYYDDKTHEHIPYTDRAGLSGTPKFASINAHLGIEQSRRDDMESLGYVFVYLMNGTLPWKDIKAKSKKQKYDKICEMKLSTSISVLCQGLPAEFALYLEYCRRLEFEEAPDYKYLYHLFMQLLQSHGYDNDCQFDWIVGEDVSLATDNLKVKQQTTDSTTTSQKQLQDSSSPSPPPQAHSQ